MEQKLTMDVADEVIQTQYPSLIKRVQSIFIDGVFIIMMMMVFSQVLNFAENTPGWVRGILFVGLWGIYEPFCMSFGCTLGNYLMKIRVRDIDHPEQRINLFFSYLRFIVKNLLGWLSFITVHSNSKKRAIHDMAAHSVMIEV